MKRFMCILMALCFCAVLAGCAKAEGISEPVGWNDAALYEYEKQGEKSPVEGLDTTVNADSGRKLIRTVLIKAETRNFDEVLDSITAELKLKGGYYQQYTVDSRYSGSRSATLTIRVPKDKADDFLSNVSGQVNVLRQEEKMDDVTLSYSDTESHLIALRAEEARLLELVSEAKDLKDLLVLEDKLSSLRYEIDRYESAIRKYDNQIDYVTVDFYLKEVEKETKTERPSLGSRMSENLRSSFESMKEFGEDTLVWLAGALPALVLLAVLAIVIVLIVKKSRKKAAERARAALARQEKE